jgi:hypothetical protein
MAHAEPPASPAAAHGISYQGPVSRVQSAHVTRVLIVEEQPESASYQREGLTKHVFIPDVVQKRMMSGDLPL